MTAQLKRSGYRVNPKRVARLMRKMGIQAIYPQPRTSMANSEHRIYPYLLRGVEIVRVNQVWSCARHLYQTGWRFSLFDRRPGLVFTICFELGVIEHAGSRVLRYRIRQRHY